MERAARASRVRVVSPLAFALFWTGALWAVKREALESRMGPVVYFLCRDAAAHNVGFTVVG